MGATASRYRIASALYPSPSSSEGRSGPGRPCECCPRPLDHRLIASRNSARNSAGISANAGVVQRRRRCSGRAPKPGLQVRFLPGLFTSTSRSFAPAALKMTAVRASLKGVGGTGRCTRSLRPIPANNRYRAAPLTPRIDVPWMVGNHGRAVPREACVAPRDPGHVPRRPRHTVRANDSQPRYPQRVAAGQDLRRELLSRRRDLPTALLTGGEAHRHGQVHWAHHTLLGTRASPPPWCGSTTQPTVPASR